jgi:putative hydrolase of the HAD superfamily
MESFKLIKAIIFDLDDTLISEIEYVKSGFIAVSTYVSSIVGKFTTEHILMTLHELHETNPDKVFNRMIENLSLSSFITVKELVDVYRSHKPKLSLYEDVLPNIKKMKDQNYKLGIITDGYLVTQKNKLESLNISYLFDEIIMTDELGNDYWKPSVVPFELMSKRLNIEYSEMIYIGDNPRKDFYINSVYPITTVRINRLGYYKNFEYYQGIKENYAIKTLDQVFNIIKKVNL